MGIVKSGLFSPKHSSNGRFWGIQTIRGSDTPGTPETPYMTRVWLGRLRLHVFHRGDADPDCHDHPWGFWTFPLRSYVEEVVEPIRDTLRPGYPDPEPRFFTRLQIVPAFRWTYRPATHCHRVLGSYEGRLHVDQFFPGAVRDAPRIGARKIVTLVWREPTTRAWGFRKKRLGRWCWVPWVTYVYEGGKDAPCSDT